MRRGACYLSRIARSGGSGNRFLGRYARNSATVSSPWPLFLPQRLRRFELITETEDQAISPTTVGECPQTYLIGDGGKAAKPAVRFEYPPCLTSTDTVGNYLTFTRSQ